MDGIELVVFDLAGTTIEDRGQVPSTFVTVLRSHGIDIAEEALRAARGASKREVIYRFVKERFPGTQSDVLARTDQICDEFRAHLAQKYMDGGIHALPGAVETFAWLHKHAVKVAVNTGFDRSITETILGALGWEKGMIDAIVCSSDVPQGRPAPYMIFRAMEAARVITVRQVACVGDTVLDLQAGWNAAVQWNIGVLSGAHSKDRLEQVPHTHLLPSVAALSSLWE
jgi:phosphonatase-like hydrolase